MLNPSDSRLPHSAQQLLLQLRQALRDLLQLQKLRASVAASRSRTSWAASSGPANMKFFHGVCGGVYLTEIPLVQLRSTGRSVDYGLWMSVAMGYFSISDREITSAHCAHRCWATLTLKAALGGRQELQQSLREPRKSHRVDGIFSSWQRRRVPRSNASCRCLMAYRKGVDVSNDTFVKLVPHLAASGVWGWGTLMRSGA